MNGPFNSNKSHPVSLTFYLENASYFLDCVQEKKHSRGPEVENIHREMKYKELKLIS